MKRIALLAMLVLAGIVGASDGNLLVAVIAIVAAALVLADLIAPSE